MNTDACNFEDINIHHITECLSLSSIASFEDWYCLFRTWSCTCARMIWIFNENFGSASVKESVLSFSTITVRVLFALFCDAAQSTSSVESDFHVWFHPDFLMQWKLAHQEFFRCIERPISSLVLTLMWLFLHLIHFVFFSTSLQNTLLNWNG